jgi:hypothetical protein
MGALGWQDAAVAFAAGVALAWLVRRRLARRRRSAACEDCPGCAPGARAAHPPGAAPRSASPGATIVPLSELTRHER